MDETFSKIEKALKDREERLVEGINSWATAWTVKTDNQRKDDLNEKSDANEQTNQHETGRSVEAAGIGQIGTNRLIRDLLREMRWEISDVKDKLNAIVVSLQSTNKLISSMSDITANSTISNKRNNSNKINNNNNNSKNANNRKRNDSSSSSSSSGGDDSGGDSVSLSKQSDEGKRKRRRRRRKRSNSSSNMDDNNNNDNNSKETSAQLQILKEKIKDLENKSAVWESQIQLLREKSDVGDGQSEESPYELQLRERKKNNLIVFGLPEDESNDLHQLKALFSNIGAGVNVDDTQYFRTGRKTGKCRPLVVKLMNPEEKAEVLFKAKGLKNNRVWKGIAITHDLTKEQCQVEKVREAELRREAEERNCHLSCEDKSVWKVVGGRGTRRVILSQP